MTVHPASENERDSGSLRITVKDVFHAVNGVSDVVSEIKGSLANLAQDHTTTKATSGDHEARLRRLERWTYAIPLTAITASAAALAAIIQAS
jgi:hypothetical protein